MLGNRRAARTLITGTLTVGLVIMGMPLVALGLGEDVDVLAGTLDAAVAAPAWGQEFSRIEDVQFTDGSVASLCPVVAWTWEFGDQTFSAEQNPTHRFSVLGQYEATLVVTGACGRIDAAPVQFSIINLAPVAALALPSGAPAPGESFTLDGSGSSDLDGSLSSYRYTIDGVAQPSQAAPTLAWTFTQAGAHVVELTVVDNEGKSSSPAVALLEVAPGPLASLTVGPEVAEVPAGGSHLFTAEGADAYGNAVPVQPAWSATCGAIDAGFFQAGTVAGPCEVSASQDGFTDAEAFAIVAGPLAHLALEGPAEVVAGTFAVYTADGTDAFGNPVELLQSSLLFEVPTTAGGTQVCHSERDVTGCLAVTVVPDELFSLLVSGPDQAVAGSEHTFSLLGFDQYGNEVALSAADFAWTAPTQAGPAMACWSEGDRTSCANVQVLPDALASIALTGPATVVAGHVAPFAVDGFDQHGNSVALLLDVLEWTAPTVAGPALACYAEEGIEGCASVDVTPDALTTITVSGPAQLVAGTTGTYDLSGADQWGNAVALAQEHLDYQAPLVAGADVVCYTEQEATGCANVQVLPDALAHIALSGPDRVVAGTTALYHLAGSDQYGNAVSLAQGTLEWAAPTSAGPAMACYSEQDVESCAAVLVTHDALASIEITGPASVQAGTYADYSHAGFDQYGNAVPLLWSGQTWIVPETVGPNQVCYEEQGVSACIPVEVTPAGLYAISVTGPDTLQVGTGATYLLAGSDPFGNPIALAQGSLEYLAPTAPGTVQVCYAEQDVTGCREVLVTPGPLDTITLTGPAEAVAGEQLEFAVAGFDGYGNPLGLAQASLSWPAPTLVGPEQVCYTEQGITGCADVLVVAGPLSSLSLTGPDEVPAGGSASFDLAGSDAFGNAVALAQSSLAWDAPTVAGPASVCYDEQGVSACKVVSVLAGPLDRIDVGGPSQMTAGTSAVFALAGFDAFGNGLDLAQGTLDYTAPTQAGNALACYSEQGIEGCAAIQVVPDALSVITVSGPSEVVVGETATYALGGADQYGNALALAQSSLEWTAPTFPGSANVCYEEQGASGCSLVNVVHGPLASIVVSGADELVVGTAGDFDLDGFDAFGNPVALAQGTLAWTAPTAVGTGNACYSEQGIEGCKSVAYVADALATLTVSGPATVTAGSPASFDLAGFDQYGNDVALAQSTLDVPALTLAGPAQACYEEGGVQGCAAYEVVAGPLAALSLDGPSEAQAGSVVTFALSGADAFGNAVALASSAFAWTAPGLVGTHEACYTEQDVEGCASVAVVPGPLARIAVSPGSAVTNVNQGNDIAYSAQGLDAFGNVVAEPLDFAWSTDLGVIDAASGVYKAITAGTGTVTATADGVSGSAPVTVLNTLTSSVVLNQARYAMGQPVRGHVLVAFADGMPVQGAKVTLDFRGLSLGTGAECSEQVTGLTNGAGLMQFQAPQDCARYLGDYKIDSTATWKANRGTASKTYRVNLF